MKIKIGPYKNWYGPYQLAETLCFWAKKEKDEYGIPRTQDWVHDFGEWLAHGEVQEKKRVRHKFISEPRHHTWLYKLLSWIDSKRERTIKIDIDKYDTWNMNNTLAMIIVPMLMQLRVDTHSHPPQFGHDYEKNYMQMDFEGEGFDIDGDETFKDGMELWQETLDEMIWAFEQVNTDWEDQYHHGHIDFEAVPCEDSDNWMLEKGPDDTSWIDTKGRERHIERMQNGFALFAKYYWNLWD